MRKTHLLTWLTALLLSVALFCPAQQAAAQEAKPLVTLSFSGYDALMADIDYIGKLGGNAELAKGLENILTATTQGKGLEGLDKARPLGLVVLPKPDATTPEARVFAFLPVSDLNKLLSALEAFQVETSDGPNGSKQLAIPNGPPGLFIKQIGNWAYLTNDPSDFDAAPADPVALLGGSEKKYDVALRLLAKNLPDEMRTALIQQVEMLFQFVTMQAPNEVSAAQFKQAVEQIKRLINETDTVTLGFVINDKAGKTYLDVEFTAKPGTELAQQMAQIKKAPSAYAGFYVPEATLTANWVRKLAPTDITQTTTQIKALHKEFTQALENQDLTEDQAQKAKKLIGDLVDVIVKTLEGGKMDGGLAVWLDANTAAMVAGGVVVDGQKLEATLKEIVTLITEDTPDLKPLLKFNAETHEGVTMHTFTMPVPSIPGRDKVVDLVGENLDVVIGTSPTGVYLAAGRDAMAKLKAAIDASKSAAATDVLPTRLSLALTPLVKFIAKMVDDDDAKQKLDIAAALLEQAGSENHVLVTIESIPGGIRERIEVEQGILKTLGAMSQQMAPGAPAP